MVVVAWMSAELVRWLKGDAGLFGFEQVEGYAQEAFAEVLGVHRTYMGGLERGICTYSQTVDKHSRW